MLTQPIQFGDPVYLDESQFSVVATGRTEGVSADAMILCPDGWRPIREIAVGDSVSTRANGSATVTGLTLQEMTTDFDTHFVEIVAGVLGADNAVLVAHDQCIFMRHFLAAAFFGALEIVVPAHLISNGQRLGRSSRNFASLCLLECAEQEIICVNGVWMGSVLGERAPARLRVDASQSALILQTDAFFRAPSASK
jgi:hypothetical protein